MNSIRVLSLLAAVVLVAAAGCERKVTNEVTNVIPAGEAAYIGSAACGACHDDIYASFMKTGHPFVLNEADSVQSSGYFPDFVTPLEIPSDLAWGEIDKIIGGFWWKAHYIEPTNGQIYIGPDRQYNLIGGFEGFAAYDGSTPDFKDYDCGPCHTTGYAAEGNQEGKSGLVGTWAFGGVQCEECHGPGGLHQIEPHDVNMIVDRSSEKCGQCHSRGEVGQIAAADGFVQHYQQWNEMFVTKHMALECVDCHDVHVGLHPGNPTRSDAIRQKCENCHLEETQSFAASELEHYDNEVPCIECHMTMAAKSAVEQDDYVGDVHSHLMVINVDATASMIKESGTEANPYLTLEYTCLKSGCHDPEDAEYTKSWAAANADRVHAKTIGDISSCFTCHGDDDFALLAARQEYEHSLHGTGHTYNENRNVDAFYSSCERCHTNEGFVARVTGVPAVGDHFTRIGCFTCHEPHTTGTLALRVEGAVTLADGTSFDREEANTCASCHQSRRKASTYVFDGVEMGERFGPHHSNQADMLLGVNAYEYTEYEYESSAHTNSAAEGCLNCHMVKAAYATGGHAFNVYDEEEDFENTYGCNVGTCHDGDVETFDYDSTQTEIDALLASLRTLLVADSLWDDVNDYPMDRTVADADSAGAVYNFLFVTEDRSHGVHNFDYAEGLLESSIAFLGGGEGKNGTGLQALSAH